jgi:hypothetical protein
LWGTLTRRLRFEFFPVGYFVVPAKPDKRPGTSADPEAKEPAVITDG